VAHANLRPFGLEQFPYFHRHCHRSSWPATVVVQSVGNFCSMNRQFFSAAAITFAVGNASSTSPRSCSRQRITSFIELSRLLLRFSKERGTGEKDLCSIRRPGEGMGVQLLLVKRKRLPESRKSARPFRDVIGVLIRTVCRGVPKGMRCTCHRRPLRERACPERVSGRSRLSSASTSKDRCENDYAANPETRWRSRQRAVRR